MKTSSSPIEYFDPKDENIKKEILAMIAQFLDENGYKSSAQVLSDEANLKSEEEDQKKTELGALKAALKSDDWPKIESLQLEKSLAPRFIYQVYRYHFITLLSSGDSQAALQFLSGRLRPYKNFEEPAKDFEYLCKLLVNSSSANNPEQIPNANETLNKLLSFIDTAMGSSAFTYTNTTTVIPNGRLFRLIQQSVSLSLSKYSSMCSVKSIVNDFKPAIFPEETSKSLPVQHKGSVKTLCYIPNTQTIVSGDSEGDVVIWDLKRRMKTGVLKGQKGRIWSVASKVPTIAVSGSGDGSIFVWNLSNRSSPIVIRDHENDIYSVDINKSSTKLISGGFDKSFSMYDIETGKKIFQETKHIAPITCVKFDSSGQLAITGGNDRSIKIWDMRNALVVRELPTVLSEVSAVDSDTTFTRIIGSTNNSTIRLWDVRMSEAVSMFRGHQNTSKYFIRACFGPNDRTILTGSEDGFVYVYGCSSGSVVEKLCTGQNTAYGMVYCESPKMFVSYGDSNVIQLYEAKSNQ